MEWKRGGVRFRVRGGQENRRRKRERRDRFNPTGRPQTKEVVVGTCVQLCDNTQLKSEDWVLHNHPCDKKPRHMSTQHTCNMHVLGEYCFNTISGRLMINPGTICHVPPCSTMHTWSPIVREREGAFEI